LAWQAQLYDWISETNNDEDIRKIKSERGKKPKIDQVREKQIQIEVREAPQRSSLRRLRGKFQVGKTAIGEFIHKKGYKYKKSGDSRRLSVPLLIFGSKEPLKAMKSR